MTNQKTISFDARLILFLWKYLGTWTVLALIGLAFTGYYWITVCRLSDDDLRHRMQAYAEVLRIRLDPDKPEKFEKAYANLLNQFTQAPLGFSFYSRDPINKDYLDATTGSITPPAGFKEAVQRLAEADAPSYEFTTAAVDVTSYLQLWSRPPLPRPGWWSRFAVDDYKYQGVDFGVPTGDLSHLRNDASLFRTHREMFASDCNRYWKMFSNAPFELQLTPWKLLKFSDEKRYKLNNQIPLGFGTLLLACGFLLQFRLVDYKKPQKMSELHVLRYKSTETWTPIWWKTRRVSADDLSLFQRSWLKWAISAAVVLMISIELLANTPRQRVEWIVNLPIMVITGIVLPIVWVTLGDLGSRTLNPDLVEYTRAFRRRVLRPLFVGILVMTVAVAWALLYSIFDLPGTPRQTLRAAIQVSACLLTLILLVRLLTNLNRQFRAMDAGRRAPIEAKKEDQMNANESDIIAEFFPGLDDRATRAVLLALLPLPVIVDSFFGR